MKIFRITSVRQKLIGISMIASALALLLAGAALSVYDYLQFRRLLHQEMAVLAAVIGDRSTAALSFDDQDQAAENLAASEARRSMVSACIYDAEGEVFASWMRSARTEGPPPAPCPERPPADGTRADERSLIQVRPILLDGGRIGSVYLRAELRDLELRFAHYSGVTVFVVLLAAGVAYFASARLQRIVSDPIRALARTAGTISAKQGYSVRAIKTSDDELGVLVDAFNRMLDNLEQRDRELKDANCRLEDLVEELETKHTELERFTYTVSHDLRSPLITIRGFLGMVLKDARAGNWHRAEGDMQRIHAATDKMDQLLKELLELSRIGRLVNEPQWIPFAELVQESLELAAGRISEGRVEVVVASDLPTVFGDRQRLLEVVQNLIENAAKFMGDQQRPRIEIVFRSQDGAFCIRDNGIGIDPQYHHRVFDLFERLDTTTEGTGIGLSIVQRIVEFHGGRIWVESQGRGHGTAFCFTLSSVLLGNDRPGVLGNEEMEPEGAWEV